MRQLFLLLIIVGFNVGGQYLMKRGMTSVGAIQGNFQALYSGLTQAIFSPFVLGGVAAYGFSSIFWLVMLSRVELSYAYPALSIGYVMVTVVSVFLLGEEVSITRWLAVLVICGGVVLLSRS